MVHTCSLTPDDVASLGEYGIGATADCPLLRDGCETAPCEFSQQGPHWAQGGAGGYVSVVARVTPNFDTIGVCVGGGGVEGWVKPDHLKTSSETQGRQTAGLGGVNHGPHCDTLEGGTSLSGAVECNTGELSIGNIGSLQDLSGETPLTEQQECKGGGGGAATGVYALDSKSGDWEWLAVAPGGGGGTFRGGAGGSGTRAKGQKEVQAGLRGTSPEHGKGGGGGGYGVEAKEAGDGGAGYFHKRLGLDPVSLVSDTPERPGDPWNTEVGPSVGPLPARALPADRNTYTGSASTVGSRGFISRAHTFDDFENDGRFSTFSHYNPDLHIDPTYATADWQGVKDPWHGFQKPGDGFALATEDMSSGIYADAWVKVQTTCSCVIEANTLSDPNPDGRPRHFVASQSLSAGMVTFSFHDYSGCEEGFQFYRGNTLLNAEFQARGQCFELLAPSHIGDSLSATNDEEKLLLPPGSTHTYCVKAVGSPVGEMSAFYASGSTCTNLTIKWGGSVKGMVRSQADQTIGVSGVLVSVYLLTEEEHDNGAVREWSFGSTGSRRARAAGNVTVPETTPTPPGFRVQPPARSTQRSRRQDTGQSCPPELALDENSLPIHRFWPETGSGQTLSLPCPDLGLGVSVLNRTCSYAGNWGETDGECAPVLVQFTTPQAIFVRLENIKFAANRHLLYNTDAATCAWHCLTLNTTCRSFEVFRGDTQPICFISSVHSNDTDVAFLPARFGSIQYYELANPALRDTFEVLDQDLVDLYVPTYTGVCSIEVLAAQGDWPYDPESSTHYMDQHQHLRQIEAEGCNKVEGNLILRCHEGCDYRLRRALATFGAVMTPADGRTFCGAPPSPNGAWQNYTIERMGAELTAICDAKVLMAHCLTHFLQGNFLTVRILRVMGLLRR